MTRLPINLKAHGIIVMCDITDEITVGSQINHGGKDHV
jgi:hypothetical protein